jgi:hypothetical protein
LLQEYLSCPGQPSTTPRRRPYQRYEEAVEYSAREHIATQKRPLSVFLFVKQGAFWISCAMPLFVPASRRCRLYHPPSIGRTVERIGLRVAYNASVATKEK